MLQSDTLNLSNEAREGIQYLLANEEFWQVLLSDMSLGFLGLAVYVIIALRDIIMSIGIWKFILRHKRFFLWHQSAITIIAIAYQVGPDELVGLLQAFAINLPGEFAFVTFGAILAKVANGDNKKKMEAEIEHARFIKNNTGKKYRKNFPPDNN